MKKLKRWNELAKRLPKDKIISMVEVGVWRGKMIAALLDLLPMLNWYGIDKWKVPEAGSSYAKSGAQIASKPQAEYDLAYKQTLEAIKNCMSRTHIIISDSVAAASKFDDGSLDVVFIDGDHSYEGTSRDIKAWKSKVKKGGWLCGHDYNNPPADVKRAVDEILGPVELGEDHSWFLRIV